MDLFISHNIYINGPQRNIFMKKCNKCNIMKDFIFFSIKKSSKDGYNNICKECRKLYNKQNNESIKQYYLDNKEKMNSYNKQQYEYNKEIHNKRVIKWQQENPDRKKEYFKKWRDKNKEYFRSYAKGYYKNSNNKIAHIMRVRMSSELKDVKYKSTIKLLGCSIEEFKQYILNNFKPEMTWENHGEIWELDHILPCSSFDLTILEEQQKCFHYTNYQPLFKTTAIAESFGYNDEIGNRNKYNK